MGLISSIPYINSDPFWHTACQYESLLSARLLIHGILGPDSLSYRKLIRWIRAVFDEK